MKQTILQRIAMLFPSTGKRLTETDKFIDSECSYLESLLPSGSGIDSGMKIDIEKSTRNAVVLTGDYHYMDEYGGYAGWFGFSVKFESDLVNAKPFISVFRCTYNYSECKSVKELFEDYLCETVDYEVNIEREWSWNEDEGYCELLNASSLPAV